jgi:hypothetical protein
VPYADGRFRCDFVAKGVLIEYFGLIGDPDYDERHKAKLQYCLDGGFHVVCLYPEDLVDRNQMRKKLASFSVVQSPEGPECGVGRSRYKIRQAPEHLERLSGSPGRTVVGRFNSARRRSVYEGMSVELITEL